VVYVSHADDTLSVNFAFASIEPGTYKVVPMDSQTPESLFKDVPNLKSIKPSLKVFISIGGWYIYLFDMSHMTTLTFSQGPFQIMGQSHNPYLVR
jgi:GH18 family chitinase